VATISAVGENWSLDDVATQNLARAPNRPPHDRCAAHAEAERRSKVGRLRPSASEHARAVSPPESALALHDQRQQQKVGQLSLFMMANSLVQIAHRGSFGSAQIPLGVGRKLLRLVLGSRI
jgi:hypothetical protein